MIKIKVGEFYYLKDYFSSVPSMVTIKIEWKIIPSEAYMVNVVERHGYHLKVPMPLVISRCDLERFCIKIPKLKRILLYKGI